MEPATKLIILVSIHFFILFTAFNAFQTILTRIYEEEGDRSLGPFTFALNYATFLITNFFVSKVPYSEKWQITFATLTYAFNYSTGFFMAGKPTYVKYLFAAVGAIVNGIGGSFLWTSIGSYIHKVCHFYNKISEKGHYFGLFNSIFCSSTILGAVLVTFGLTLFQHNIYFIIVSSVAFLAFVFGIFFIKDIKLEQTDALQMKEGNEVQGVWERAKASFMSTLSFYPIMKYSLGLIVLDGLNLGVVTSTMLHVMPEVSDPKQNSFNIGTCLFIYGIGCTIGGYLGGRLCDKLRIRISSTITVFLYSISCLMSIGAKEIFQLWAARLSCFLWGATLYFLTANLLVICSRLYQGKPQSFALVKQFHAVAFVIYEIIAMSTNNFLSVTYIMFVLLVFGIPAFWGIHNAAEESKFQLMDRQNQSESENIEAGNKQSLIEK